MNSVVSASRRRVASLAWRRVLAVALVLAAAAPGVALAAASPLAGGAACELVEGLPGPRDPLRSKGPYVKALRKLERAGADRAKLRRAYDALRAATDKLLAGAQKVFHPRRGKVDKARARGFLERYVLGRGAVLVIADDRFVPVRGVTVATVVAACRSGAVNDALALARLAAPRDPALAGLAALVLLDAGRPEEAAELAPRLSREGFLSPWVMAELSADPATRQEAHAIATRRVTTPAQDAAVRAQRRRLAARLARPPSPTTPGAK